MRWVPIFLVAILIAVAYAGSRHPASTPVPAAISTSTEATSSTVVASSTATHSKLPVGPTIVLTPASIIQGEPDLVSVTATTSIKSITWDGKPLGVFIYKGMPSALIAADFRLEAGTYSIVATLPDGTKIKKSLVVGKRAVVEAPLGIPESLGGNTPEAQKELVAELARENTLLNSLVSAKTALWDGPFVYPVADPVVTDPYGYDRLTGASTIVHKGTDFHAASGTPVFAMNSGVVRLARQFTDYGNTVVIDHGQGLMTLYMHLSRMFVKEGDSIGKGKLIALSGQTGYAEGAHLHISVRIDNISIDPMKFIQLFK